MTTMLLEKLCKYSRGDPSGCVIWTGGVSKCGYGNVRDGAKQKSAHRAAYEEYHGAIPNGLFVCHRCDNRLCINPLHLFTGTPADNSHDMKSKGRSPRSRVKLTPEAIKAITLDGRTRKQVAQSFGIHMRYVYAIRRQMTTRERASDNNA